MLAQLEGVYRHLLVLQSLYSDHLSESVKYEIVTLYKETMKGIGKIIQAGQEHGYFIDGDPENKANLAARV